MNERTASNCTKPPGFPSRDGAARGASGVLCGLRSKPRRRAGRVRGGREHRAFNRTRVPAAPWAATYRLRTLPGRLGRDDGLLTLRVPHRPRRPERASPVVTGWSTRREPDACGGGAFGGGAWLAHQAADMGQSLRRSCGGAELRVPAARKQSGKSTTAFGRSPTRSTIAFPGSSAGGTWRCACTGRSCITPARSGHFNRICTRCLMGKARRSSSRAGWKRLTSIRSRPDFRVRLAPGQARCIPVQRGPAGALASDAERDLFFCRALRNSRWQV